VTELAPSEKGKTVRQARDHARYHGRVLVGGRWFSPAAPHGTANGYSNYGCHCPPCKDAVNAAIVARRRRFYAQRVLVGGRLVHPGPGTRHGVADTYKRLGCRCLPCCVAHSQLQRRRGRAAR